MMINPLFWNPLAKAAALKYWDKHDYDVRDG